MARHVVHQVEITGHEDAPVRLQGQRIDRPVRLRRRTERGVERTGRDVQRLVVDQRQRHTVHRAEAGVDWINESDPHVLVTVRHRVVEDRDDKGLARLARQKGQRAGHVVVIQAGDCGQRRSRIGDADRAGNAATAVDDDGGGRPVLVRFIKGLAETERAKMIRVLNDQRGVGAGAERAVDQGIEQKQIHRLGAFDDAIRDQRNGE